jgi:hypothetical protein
MKLYSHFIANTIKLKEIPFIRELAMESYLIENESILSLGDDELSQVEIIDTELSVIGGRKSKNSDGRIDLLVVYDNEYFGIIELKNTELTKDNYLQLKDYFNCRKEIYEKHKDSVNCSYEQSKWIGILVGTDIDRNLESDISSGNCTIDNMYSVGAITLKKYKGENNQIYVTANTYFKNNQRNMDKTKYRFNGSIYGKSRLVHAIVKKYISSNSEITISELDNIFPKELQGNFGVFTTLDKAINIYSRYKYKRHFINDDEVINVNGIDIAICSQWGIDNIKNIIKVARDKLNYKIDEV